MKVALCCRTGGLPGQGAAGEAAARRALGGCRPLGPPPVTPLRSVVASSQAWACPWLSSINGQNQPSHHKKPHPRVCLPAAPGVNLGASASLTSTRSADTKRVAKVEWSRH